MYKNFRGKSGRYVVHPCLVTTGFNGETSITANTTTDFYLTGVPNRTATIERITAACSTVTVDSDGTSTYVVSKLRNGTTATALNTAANLDALTANVAAAATLVTTLTDVQRTHLAGDIYRVRVTNDSAAIDTQPVNLNWCVELNLLD